MERYTGASELPILLGYFKHHPGLVITIMYILLSLMGLLFVNQYYGHFNVPILQYSEFTDLLAVGYRQPLALLMLFSAMGLTIVFDSLGCWIKSLHTTIEQRNVVSKFFIRVIFPVPKYRITMILVHITGLIAYLWLFVILAADYKAGVVKEEMEYNISVVQGDQTTMGHLLGTTFNFIFVYDPTQDNVEIFTIEAVDRMMPLIPEKS